MTPMADGTGPLGQGPAGRGMGPWGGGQRRGRGAGHGQDGRGAGRGRCFRSGRRQGQMQQETPASTDRFKREQSCLRKGESLCQWEIEQALGAMDQ
ncbi:MAG: DUF5320 family protein [Verrucomicrobiia bacterium]